ncbi:hypothetical protein AAF712_006769 [Marasmius tenuissimus]|uniref:Uncharacterized protein n=1 Tax=Marasmius tenuissimus TaxID=585030 RepID=A0ABR2ZXV5_9AGAR
MAIDWHSAHMMTRNADSFSKLLHAFVGLYLWEWFNSLDFEYKLITGRHKFKWPLGDDQVFYFLNRYALLGVCIGFMVFLDTKIEASNCEAMYIFIQAMGSLSMGLACVNLAIRTIAIWKNDRHVVVVLTVIILGHWALILRDIPIVRAKWDGDQGCIFIDNEHNLVTGMYVYAMGIDFIVMCLMAYKTGIQLNNRTRLIKILVVDGVLYFIIAFLVNLMGVVFSALNLNPIMSVIGVVPATMISTVSSSFQSIAAQSSG